MKKVTLIGLFIGIAVSISMVVLADPPGDENPTYTQASLDAKIEELIRSKTDLRKIHRGPVERLRAELLEYGTPEQVKYLDQELDKKLLSPKDIDLCKALGPLIDNAKNRVAESDRYWERYLNGLFLLKASAFTSDSLGDEIGLLTAEEEAESPADESGGCLLPRETTGVSEEVYERVRAFLEAARSSDAPRISGTEGMYGAVFELLFRKEIASDQSYIDAVKDELRTVGFIAPYADGDSFLTTHLYVSALLARSSIHDNELERLKGALQEEYDNSGAVYELGRDLPGVSYDLDRKDIPQGPRASAARAIPTFLALYKHETDPVEKAKHRERLFNYTKYFVSPAVLPWLVLASEGGDFAAHVGKDKLGYHYLYPAMPYVAAALKLFQLEGKEEEIEDLAKVEKRLGHLLANIQQSDGLFVSNDYWIRGVHDAAKNPHVGLTLLPLIKNGCGKDGVAPSLGILLEEIRELASTEEQVLSDEEIFEILGNGGEGLLPAQSLWAANKLRKTNPDQTETIINLYLDALGSEDYSDRGEAAEALKELISDPNELFAHLQRALPRDGFKAAVGILELMGNLARDHEAIKTEIVSRYLVPALGYSDPQIRIVALEAIESLAYKDESLIAHLIPLLEDSDEEVRKTAISKLGREKWVSDHDEIIPSIISALNDESVDIRTGALDAIGRFIEDHDELTEHVIRMLNDPDWRVRRDAVDALPAEKHPELAAHILHLTSDPNPVVRKYVIEALGSAAKTDETYLAPIIAALTDPELDVREMAIRSIGNFVSDKPELIPHITLATKDEGVWVRKEAIEILGNLVSEHRELIPYLTEAAGDEDDDVREAAIEGLGKIAGGNEELISYISRATEDEDTGVRITAVRELARFVPDNSDLVPLIIKRLDDEDSMVRFEARSALGDIGSLARDAVPKLRQTLRTSDSKYERGHSAAVLGEIGPEARAAVPELIAALSDEEEDVRKAAVRALAGIGPEAVTAAVSDLRKTLKDEEKWVRRVSAEALGLASEEALATVVPELMEALEDEDYGVRDRVLASLGNLGPGSAAAVPELIEGLSNENYRVRVVSARSLGRIGPGASDAVPILTDLALEDSGFRVSESAAIALGRIGSAAEPAVLRFIGNLRDGTTRYEARNTLKLVGRTAVPALARVRKDSDRGFRRTVSRILDEIAENEIPTLREELLDENWEVRKEAARTLGLLGSSARDALPDLVRAYRTEQRKQFEALSGLRARQRRSMQFVSRRRGVIGVMFDAIGRIDSVTQVDMTFD
ncbi:HEAT repeat domain-containing protein [Bdellovibrionota bacterium]